LRNGWSRIAAVIVTCPSCAARYRLSDSALERPARLKCAACGHRWMPVAEPTAPAPVVAPPPPVVPPPRAPISEADEDAAMRAVQEQIRARWQDAVTPVAPPLPPGDITEELEPPPAPALFTEEEEAAAPPKSTLLRNLVAVIAGTALAIAAAGLWVGRQDLGAIPLMGDVMQQIDPPVPVELTVVGSTSDLSSGNRVLEVTGLIINRGKTMISVPALEATLASPQGVALRWTIPPPRRSLGPGQQVAYTSTVTGFPETATKLQVRAVE
jgi:predicted Zn finger-like uncharacterized protein